MTMSDYTPNTSPNYMSSDWGNSQTKYTAMNIQHVTSKAEFAINMLEGVVNGFDGIEKEIVDASNATVPITREGLRAFAYRIDTQQNQIKQSLDQLKQMLNEIKNSSGNIQSQRTSW
jgi:translation initiation factor 2 alpha subunit (eIF-2alpha)